MADAKLSALAALTGANSASDDLLYIDDISVTTSKSITRAELAIGMSATQTEQETATATNKHVNPAVQGFHPSAAKAWGFFSAPTTLNISYPGAASCVKNSTGNFTITHGCTFSTTNYAISVTAEKATAVISQVSTRTATTLTLLFFDAAGVAVDPDNFHYSCFGDL